MNFEEDLLYHVYNQGNNKQRIFFEEDNYSYFIKKASKYILPYGDIIAWCLMPNHFHFLIKVNNLDLIPQKSDKLRSINDSIGIMLRSYTQGINKKYKRSGSLFRSRTKADCLNKIVKLSIPWYLKEGIVKINYKEPDQMYPQTCFDYIHENPVKAGLVKRAADWEFSSYNEYLRSSVHSLINKEVSQEYINLERLI